MRTLGCMILALGLGISASAQTYGPSFYTVTSSGTLWEVTKSGMATSLSDLNTPSYGVTMGFDNQRVYWTGLGSTFTTVAGTINEWDGTANTTVLSTTDYQIYDVLTTQNGEIVFTGVDKNSTPGLFKWAGGSAVTTITTQAALGATGSFNGGLDINIFTGNYLLPNGAFTTPGQIWDVAEDGTARSLVSGAPTGGRYSISQDRQNGYIYQSGFSDYRTVDPAGTQTVKRPTGTMTDYYYALRIDRASVPAAQRRLWAIYQSTSTTSDGIHEVSDPLGTPAYTSTVSGTATSGTTYEMVFKGEKNINSLKFGPGQYSLNFSFPGEAGVPYVVALSLTGFRPATTLGDGRHICLTLDNLTPLSLQNVLKPLFDPGSGTLSAQAMAVGSINVRRDNLGIKLYMVAATIVGSQIRTISDPYVMRL